MKKDSALWAARRIHRILSNAQVRQKADSVPSLSTLVSEQRLLEQCWHMFNKARARNWTHTADIFQRRLFSQIAAVHAASRNFHPARLADIPALADILSEIRHLEDDFDLVTIFPKEKYISVTTDAITLEDVNLGPFSIRLDLDRLAQRRDVTAFRIIADSANPATGDSSCTHPHVRDEALCAGEATAPVSNALSEGRVGDAFQLINRVLHTYNGGSAYVSLEDWDGRACDDCGETRSRESLCFCDHCNSDFCDDCMRTCDRCDQSVCFGCSEENDVGDRLCPKCKILDDKESDEADEEEETPVSDDPIHDSTEEEPQPSSSPETIHDSNSNSAHTRPSGVELPGGPPIGDGRSVRIDISAARAA